MDRPESRLNLPESHSKSPEIASNDDPRKSQLCLAGNRVLRPPDFAHRLAPFVYHRKSAHGCPATDDRVSQAHEPPRFSLSGLAGCGSRLHGSGASAGLLHTGHGSPGQLLEPPGMEDLISGRFGSHMLSRIRRVWLAGHGFLSRVSRHLSSLLPISASLSIPLISVSLSPSISHLSFSPLCSR